MTREEATNEINKVFTSAYANYIVTALTEGATVSDFQRRYGRAYETGVKDGLVQEPCGDAVSRQAVDRLAQEYLRKPTKENIAFYEHFRELPPVTPQESRWVPVTERLPEEGTFVLASYNSDEGTDVVMTYYSKYGFARGLMTAWMPLPEPYREVSE